jgi:hypothetical protein
VLCSAINHKLYALCAMPNRASVYLVVLNLNGDNGVVPRERGV